MNDIRSQIEEISDKETFLSFLEQLILDFRENPQDWENKTIDLYLEGMQSWVEDASSSGFFDIDWNHINYSILAKILYMGKLYE